MSLCRPGQFTQWTLTRDGASLSQLIRTRSPFVWSRRLQEWTKRLQHTIHLHSSPLEAQIIKTTWQSMVVRLDQHKLSWMAQCSPPMSPTIMISVSQMARILRCRSSCWLRRIVRKAAQWEKQAMETLACRTTRPITFSITAQTRICMIDDQWRVVILICLRISDSKCKWARKVKVQWWGGRSAPLPEIIPYTLLKALEDHRDHRRRSFRISRTTRESVPTSRSIQKLLAVCFHLRAHETSLVATIRKLVVLYLTREQDEASGVSYWRMDLSL